MCKPFVIIISYTYNNYTYYKMSESLIIIKVLTITDHTVVFNFITTRLVGNLWIFYFDLAVPKKQFIIYLFQNHISNCWNCFMIVSKLIEGYLQNFIILHSVEKLTTAIHYNTWHYKLHLSKHIVQYIDILQQKSLNKL